MVLVQQDLLGSLPPLAFLHFFSILKLLESQEHALVLPNSISPTLPQPGLPISHHVLLPQEAGGEL